MIKLVFRVTMVILILIFAIIISYLLTHSNLDPVDKNDNSPIYIYVDEDQSQQEFFDYLKSQDLIRDSKASNDYCEQTNCELIEGHFKLSKSMSSQEIIEHIQLENNILNEVFLDISSGDTNSVIAQKLETITLIPKEEFLETWNNKDILEDYIGTYWYISSDILDTDIINSLEGYFPAATYKINDGATVEEITTQMLDNGLYMYAKYKEIESDFSFHEILTLGSIIEKESRNISDDKSISAIYINRLNNPQYGYLESEASVLYLQQIGYMLNDEDNNPYNTFENTGLPPGPIAVASTYAIEAVYYPNNNKYYYYYYDSQSNIIYAKTYEENVENMCSDKNQKNTQCK